MSSPTQRTLERLRKEGFRAQVVERWIGPHAGSGPRIGKRVDLFGCIDIVALDGKPGVLGVQACADSGLAAHVAKARIDCYEALRQWLAAGNRYAVWGWKKRAPVRGKRKLWEARIVELSLNDLGGTDIATTRVTEKPKRQPGSRQVALPFGEGP